MEGNLLSISKIFTEKLLRIPDYQRGYAWTNKEVNEYWNDLIQLEDDKSHYVGVLTLEDVPKGTLEQWHEDQWIIKARGYNAFYVVDGQQRLTTTIILIQAIIETIEERFVAPEDELVLNYNSLKEVRDKYVYLSRDKGVSRSYIFGYEKDNPSYEYLKVNIFKERSYNYGLLEETIYTTNLSNTKAIFKENLAAMSKGDVEKIYKKVTQCFVFNIYSLDQEIDTYVAFETMNNRGKSLSHLELLKNRLIFLTTKLKEDEYEKNGLRHSINECWKSVYHYLGKSKHNPLDDDEFLYSHFNLYFEAQTVHHPVHGEIIINIDKRKYKNYLLEDVFTQKSLTGIDSKLTLNGTFINNYVSSLKDSVEHWHSIFNPSVEKLGEQVAFWMETLHKNPKWMGSGSALILAFFRSTSDEKKRVNFLKALERSVFVEHNLFGPYYHYYSDRPATNKLAKKLVNGEMSCDNLIATLSSTTDNLLKENRLIWTSEFRKNANFYKWSATRLVLFEYELHLAKEQKSDRLKLAWSEFSKLEPNSEYKTIEHIYPQTARAQYWRDRFGGLTQSDKKLLKHTLGNLVPLSKSKNSQLSNKGFDQKVKLGFQYGCYSEIEVAQNEHWKPENIIKRSIKLLRFMDKRWKLGISSSGSHADENYLKFCGLYELYKKLGMNKS